MKSEKTTGIMSISRSIVSVIAILNAMSIIIAAFVGPKQHQSGNIVHRDLRLHQPAAEVIRTDECTLQTTTSRFSSVSSAHEVKIDPKICFIHDDLHAVDELCSYETSLDTAKSLNLPLLSVSEWLDQDDCKCALHLIPYNNDNSLETYALAIDTLPPANKRRRGKRKYDKTSAFFVDLCPPSNTKAGRRVKGASGTPDLLLKAVQPQKGTNGNEGCVVYDLTAGLGQDSLIFAMNGAKKVHMVERDPIVFALLDDALRRLRLLADSEILEGANQMEKEQHLLANLLSEKLTLTNADAKDWLAHHEDFINNANVAIL